MIGWSPPANSLSAERRLKEAQETIASYEETVKGLEEQLAAIAVLRSAGFTTTTQKPRSKAAA